MLNGTIYLLELFQVEVFWIMVVEKVALPDLTKRLFATARADSSTAVDDVRMDLAFAVVTVQRLLIIFHVHARFIACFKVAVIVKM